MPDRARALLATTLALTALPAPLLAWAATERRDLPWRRTRDPWLVLVSETMLQQTQVDRVIPKYAAFIERFPTPQACSGAPAADVIALWSGLGYNRRAVNLWRAAGDIVEHHAGVFPRELDDLLSLPGVGPYTCLLYTSPSPRDATLSRMPSSA